MNLIRTLESGAKLEIQQASFEKANALLKAVMREIQGVSLSFGITGNIRNLGELEVNDNVINTLKDVVSRIIASDAIETAVWPCMATVLYNGKKITPEVFENEEARGDFLIVLKEVMVYNLAPFFKSLNSLLPNIGQKGINIQK